MLRSGKEDNSLQAKQNPESAFNIFTNNDHLKINQCINLKAQEPNKNRFHFDNIKSFKKPRPKLKSLRANFNIDTLHSKSAALPQLVKSSSGVREPEAGQPQSFEFKTLNLDSSDLIIQQHRQKNTKILNEMIDILRTGPVKVNERETRKLKEIKSIKEKMKSQESYINQFFENDTSLRISTGVGQREPKIVSNNQQFFKFCRKVSKLPSKNIIRNIYSEERTRPSMKQTLKKNQSMLQAKPLQLLTFYTPSKDINNSRPTHAKTVPNQFAS